MFRVIIEMGSSFFYWIELILLKNLVAADSFVALTGSSIFYVNYETYKELFKNARV